MFPFRDGRGRKLFGLITKMAETGEGTSRLFYAVIITGASRETTLEDVRKFLSDCSIKEVKFGSEDTGWSGSRIYVHLESMEDFEKACLKDNHQLRWQKVGVMSVTKENYYRAVGGAVGGANQFGAEGDSDNNASPEDITYFIRLRGLPFSAMASDILGFLKGVSVRNDEKGIHFSFGFDGRVSGEAYVEVCTEDDVQRALAHNREHLGGRYIEIFRASRAQYEWDCRRINSGGGGSGGVVRLRGLPYGCTKENIRDFFQGIMVSENKVTIQTNGNGRETGEAFVELENEEDVERALDRHKKVMGHRYIEVFRTTHNDIRPIADRWAKYTRPTPYTNRRGGRSFNDHAPPSNPYHRGAGYKFGSGNSGWREYDYYDNDRQYSKYHSMEREGGIPSYRSDYHDNDNHAVRMRGLPFSASERDIANFFAPLAPLRITIERDSFGRPSGEGEVLFSSHDNAVSAMSKDRSHIGSRYVELFLHSKPSPAAAPPTHQYSNYYIDPRSTPVNFSSNEPPLPQTHSIGAQSYNPGGYTSQTTGGYSSFAAGGPPSGHQPYSNYGQL